MSFDPFWSDPAWYALEDADKIHTPALAIYPDLVRNNIACTLRLLEGDPARWRPHLKTLKAKFAMEILVDMGVTQAKCATTRELETACAAGIKDIVISYPLQCVSVERVAAIGREYPDVRISGMLESEEAVELWTDKPHAVFIDIDMGMHRTGVSVDDHQRVLALLHAMQQKGVAFAGLHCYDGHHTQPDLTERTTMAHASYERLMLLITALDEHGIHIPEVITAGSTSFPCSLSFAAFRSGKFRHVCSPGTVVFGDLTSLSQLPKEYGYRPAAVVLSRFVSFPTSTIATLDAGSKAVSVDLGIPSCRILEYPQAEPLRPSEEHLPVNITALERLPANGELVHLVPRHVCTTVHNFGSCIVLERGNSARVESITARDRGHPILEG